jgi:uncharacterized protein (TIGR02466 family)
MEVMKVTSLFPSPLISFDLHDQQALIADLKERILKQSTADPGVSRSNEGGWQSATDFLARCGPSAEALISSTRALVDQVTMFQGDGGLERGAVTWRIQAWANVNRRGHVNARHCHPGAFWSAVFYVDDGGIAGSEEFGGAIEFTDPRGPAPIMYGPSLKMALPGCLMAGLGERVYPYTGLLLLFPAWLEHAVTPYSGDGVRISLSMNFCL